MVTYAGGGELSVTDSYTNVLPLTCEQMSKIRNRRTKVRKDQLIIFYLHNILAIWIGNMILQH
jgi:hypothetical protein